VTGRWPPMKRATGARRICGRHSNQAPTCQRQGRARPERDFGPLAGSPSSLHTGGAMIRARAVLARLPARHLRPYQPQVALVMSSWSPSRSPTATFPT
jgi:hypothetical protein